MGQQGTISGGLPTPIHPPNLTLQLVEVCRGSRYLNSFVLICLKGRSWGCPRLVMLDSPQAPNSRKQRPEVMESHRQSHIVYSFP